TLSPADYTYQRAANERATRDLARGRSRVRPSLVRATWLRADVHGTVERRRLSARDARAHRVGLGRGGARSAADAARRAALHVRDHEPPGDDGLRRQRAPPD